MAGEVLPLPAGTVFGPGEPVGIVTTLSITLAVSENQGPWKGDWVGGPHYVGLAIEDAQGQLTYGWVEMSLHARWLGGARWVVWDYAIAPSPETPIVIGSH